MHAEKTRKDFVNAMTTMLDNIETTIEAQKKILDKDKVTYDTLNQNSSKLQHRQRKYYQLKDLEAEANS